MQTAHQPPGRPLSAWRDQLRTGWADLEPTARTAVQLSLVLGGTMVAFHYSLLTLLSQLDVQSPLAYVGLVPVFALGLAAAYMKPAADEPDVYDRQVDYIVGLPLLAVAAGITILLPRHLSASYWQWRVDLVAVPLFAAGLLAIVFGTRVLWRQRLALLYLLLALPALYTVVLAAVLQGYTNFTVGALRDVVRFVPVAQAGPVVQDALFTVVHHGASFSMVVVTACSGVDGLVGFLLIGLLFSAMVRGPLLRKALWLMAGLPLLWVINLARIVFIFWVGQQWGETVALDVFHPVIGLVTFSAGVALWAMTHRWAGLSLAPLAPLPAREAPVAGAHPRPLAVPSIVAASALVIIASVVVGWGDTALKAYDLVENAVGEPRLTSFLADPAQVPGWSSTYLEQFQNGKPEFGSSSLWYRYLYRPTGGGSALRASVPITADVINAAGLSGFDAFTIQDCYNFHGWDERGTVDEDLGGGITGQALSYDSQQYGDWSVLYWVWPVQGTVDDPSGTRYERVVLYLQDGPDGWARDPRTGQRSKPSTTLGQRLVINRDFLTAFAGEIIKQQKAATPGPGTTEAVG